MATRTAPTVDGSTTYDQVSVSLIDADGGETTVTIRIDGTALDSAVETLIAEMDDLTNASIWRVERGQVYEGAKDAANGTADDYVSVKDKIRLTSKAVASGAYIRAYTPAPLGAVILPGPEVDRANANYTAWRDAVEALLPSGFTLLNVCFVQNSARGESQSPSA